jgi:hypothetical protein
MAQGDDAVPIPATKRIKYPEENVAAARVDLDSSCARIWHQLSILASGSVAAKHLPGVHGMTGSRSRGFSGDRAE